MFAPIERATKGKSLIKALCAEPSCIKKTRVNRSPAQLNAGNSAPALVIGFAQPITPIGGTEIRNRAAKNRTKCLVRQQQVSKTNSRKTPHLTQMNSPKH